MSHDREALYERALDAAFIVKGRELSYTEEAWMKAGIDAALVALSPAEPVQEPWRCAIEDARRPGAKRCRNQCPTCISAAAKHLGETF